MGDEPITRLEELRANALLAPTPTGKTSYRDLCKFIAGYWLECVQLYEGADALHPKRQRDLLARLDRDFPPGREARWGAIASWNRTPQPLRLAINEVVIPLTLKEDVATTVRDLVHDAARTDISNTRKMQFPIGDIATTTEDTKMNSITAPKSTPILSTVTYVYGVDVKTMTEDEIISTVERIDAEVERIAPLANKGSKALVKRRNTLNAAREVLIAELDSRE